MRTGGIKDWGAELTASAHELAEYLGDTSNGSALRIVGMELEEAVQEFGNVWIYNSLRFLEGYDLEQGLDLSIIEKELLSNVENEPIEAERKVKDLGEFLSKLKRGSSLAVDYAIAQAMQEEELAYEALPLPKKERHMEKVVNPQLGNAFNRYDDLGYWYQDSDITAVAKLLLKDFENTEFVGAIGRCKYQSVDAKEILKRKEKELEAEKKLTGIYNTGGNHWIAFIIFKDAAGKITCVYKDSRGKERIDFEQDIKTVFIGVKINRLQKGQAEQKLEYDNIISGGNGLVSCGIFALKNLVILARCESIDDCWNAGYYSPGDTEIQYRDTLKCNREEYGLLYAKSIYEGLQDNDSRLKDFIDQLKLEDREKLDESLISELAKQVDVSVEEIKKIIQGEGKVSYIKIAGNPSETVEDSKSIVDNKTTSVTKKFSLTNDSISTQALKEAIEAKIGLPTIEDNECYDDLAALCKATKSLSELKEKHKGRKASPILVVAMQMASNNADYKEVITQIIHKWIGLKFKDSNGNFIEHYAVKYWECGGKEIIIECLKGHYNKSKTINNYGANVMHTAVRYGYVNEICDELNKQNIDFNQKAKFERYGLNPLELAVVLDKIKELELIAKITESKPKTDLCNGNILNLAVETKSKEVLKHLLYKFKLEAKLVQDAYVYASVVGNKGDIEALKVIQESFSRYRYKSCGINKWCEATGNTALHEVIAKKGMKWLDKKNVIIHLIEQDKKLLDVHNRDNKFPIELAANKKKIVNLLQTQKNLPDKGNSEVDSIPYNPLLLGQDDKELFEALELLITMSKDVHPERVIPLLRVIHHVQANRKDINEIGKFTHPINKCFAKCYPYIGLEIFPENEEYNKIGQGLIDIREKFLGDKAYELHDLLSVNKPDTKWDGEFEQLRKLQEKSITALKAERILALRKINAPKNIEQYYIELKRYADIELELGEYENAALCYGVLAQSAPSEKEQEEAKKGIRAVEANIILNLPNSPENKVLEEIDSYTITGDYFNMDPVLKKLERAGDLFLEAGRYEPATKIYHKLISSSLEQRGTKIADGLLELEKRVFIKLSHAFNGECVCIPVFYHKNKLEKVRKSLPSIKGDLVKVQQNWNNDFKDLLKGIVREAEIQLGSLYKCAIISIGSLARREASLYSDVDLMIVTQDQVKEEKNIAYFKALIDLIKVKIISLGEMLSLPAGVKEKEVKGKIAGFFPNIERAICIGTAKELIEDVAIDHLGFQYQAAIQDSLLLNEGKEAEEIYQKYQKALISRNLRARYSIKEQLELSPFELDGKSASIDIKKQILRYPVLLINRLFAYYNLQINNHDKSQTITEYKIDALVEKSERIAKESKRKNIDLDKLEGWKDFLLYCFTEERAKGLKEWLKFGNMLRIEAHYFYEASEDNPEIVYVDKEAGVIYLENKDKRCNLCGLWELQSIYERQMQPFSRIVELWIKAIKCKSAAEISKILREESVRLLQKYEGTQDMEYAQQANWYYEKAVALDLEGSEKAWIESIKELEEPARLKGYKLEFVGNNRSIIRLPLKEEIEEQYLNLDNHEIEGKRNVIKVNINGHYFHIKECPEAPGIEYAVSSLSHLLFGYTTTPFSTLAKLTKSNGEVIPVLISRTVIGKSLREALEEEPNFLDKSIDEESFGLSFIRTLLTSPHDDQAENYVVPTILSPNNEKKLRLICVDSDHGFLPTGVEKGWLQEEKCILKSILYCSEAINNELNAKVKSILLNLEPSILLKWLNKVDKRDIINRKLFKDAPRELKKDYKILKDGEAEIVVVEIPIYFGENLVQNLYFKLMQLQEIIEEDIENNYLSIFYKIDRVVAGHYIKMLGERIIGSNEVFDKKFAEQYTQKEKKDNTGKIIRYSTPNKPPVKRSVKLKEALTSLRKLFRKIKELPNIRNMMIEGKWPNTDLDLELKQMVINGRESKESSIFVDNIFEAINKKYNKIEALTRQRKVLEMIAYKGFFSAAFISDFRRLNLRGCEAIKNEDLKVVLPEGLEWLDITDCPNLTLNALDIIAEKCPNLETLYISDEITKRGYRRRQFDKLKKLSIEKCEAGNKKVFELANSCINLKKLQITNPSVHLINATKEGYLKIIRLFLEEGADVNEGYKEGKTLLMLAAENGKEEAAEFLLGNGADINAKDKDGNTALDLAFSSRKRNIGIIKLLCAKNPNAIGNSGKTPLMLAAEMGKEKIVEFLLKSGADVNAKDKDGNTALDLAFSSRKRNIGIIKLLCAKNPNAVGKKGKTSLMLAAEMDEREVVNFLLESGANINAEDNDGNTALDLAFSSQGSNIGTIKLLCAKDPNAVGSSGKTPLMLAAYYGKEEIVKFLLESGANINAEDNDGNTALDLAFSSRKRNIEAIKLLCAKNPNAVGKYGKTPLMWAAENGQHELADYLLEKGGEIIAQDNRGFTALDFAFNYCGRGNLGIIKLLCERVYNIKNRNDKTILMFAIEARNEGIINLLMEKDVDIEARDVFGNTALIYAVETSDKKIVELLLKRGAKASIKDNRNRTALMLSASGPNSAEIAALLLKNGASIEDKDQDDNTVLDYVFSNLDVNEEVIKLLWEKDSDIRGRNGKTILMSVMEHGNKGVVKFLLSKRTDLDARDAYGNTALMYAVKKYGNKKIVNLLLRSNADINLLDNLGNSALILAAESGEEGIAKLLIESGADIDISSNNGKTALMWAIVRGWENIIELLIAQGSNIDMRDSKGKTALDYALSAGNQNIKVVKLLCKGNPNRKKRDGKTILMWAVQNDNKEIVEFLLNEGANIDHKDSEGRTALMLAAYYGRKEMVELLLREGADIKIKDNQRNTALYYATRRYNNDIAVLLCDTEAMSNQSLRRSEQIAAKLNIGKYLSKLRLSNRLNITDAPETIVILSNFRKSKIHLIPEDNHCTQHASNVYTIMRLIENNQISQNTIIALERKQLGNRFGMPDVISLANNTDVPDFIRDLPIYQDAQLYNLARLNGITVIGVEGKGLSASKESLLYNQIREDYMAYKLIECSELGYNVIFPVGSAHVEGLKSKLESKGINVLVRNSSEELGRVI